MIPEKKYNFYLSPAERKEWNDVCAMIRNSKLYPVIKNAPIAPDRGSAIRIYYEREQAQKGMQTDDSTNYKVVDDYVY